VKVGTLLDAYVEHLQARRSPVWAKVAAGIIENHIRPTWGKMAAAAVVNDPESVVRWHVKVTKKAGPTAANHSARILRASFRRAAKTNRKLPTISPTSGIEMNVEKPKQSALDFRQFPKWRERWSAIPSPTRRGFHLLCLACGGRPGEIARLTTDCIDLRARTITIRDAKAGEDIVLPMSSLIAQALKLARDGRNSDASAFVFPARGPKGHIVRFDSDGIACGNQLRHTYRNICTDVGLDEVTARLLMGHSLVGVNQGYITRAALTGGLGLRDAQRRVSRRIRQLLRLADGRTGR
jgi:integrase